jgi:hypothetical protein
MQKVKRLFTLQLKIIPLLGLVVLLTGIAPVYYLYIAEKQQIK